MNGAAFLATALVGIATGGGASFATDTAWYASQSVSQSVSQPVSQSVRRSASQSASQPSSQSVSQSVSQSASQSVSCHGAATTWWFAFLAPIPSH